MTDSLLALRMISESSQSQMQQNSHLLKRFEQQERPFYKKLFSQVLWKSITFSHQAFLAHISAIIVFVTFSFDASRGGHGKFLKKLIKRSHSRSGANADVKCKENWLLQSNVIRLQTLFSTYTYRGKMFIFFSKYL